MPLESPQLSERKLPVNHGPSKIRPVVGAIALGIGVPAVLALVLNYMRPDLIAPMLGHEFGYRLVLIEKFLCLAATTLYLAATLMQFKTRTPRVLLALAGGLFFTLPALLGVLFGPIVFAFMYGGK